MPVDGLPQLASAPGAVELPPGVINCAAYSGGKRVATLALDDIAGALAVPGQFVWLGLLEPSEGLLQRVQREFHLHDLAIEDAHAAHQRPKLEQYQGSLFVVLRTVQRPSPGAPLEFGETHIFVGHNFLVTVRHGSLRSHIGLRSRLESTPALLAKGPGFVLYALMDFIVDQYFPVVEDLEQSFEALEEEIFAEQCSRETTRSIYHLRRDLVSLKRAVMPLIEVCNRLMKFDVEMVPSDTHPYFRDVHDHLVRLNELVDSLRELLGTALDANASLISEQHTVQTKRLASWAAIIAVPTMVAGIYGMNFTQMPELHWAYGYPVALGIMAVACLGLYAAFRRSGWL
jgi:magnesium transporter